MGKHAYLILAHNEFDVLKILLKAIDDEHNDIYVHWDSKVKIRPYLSVENATLYKTKDRVNVHWADFSMVKAEYVLFQEAFNNGPYDYYHLISGVDLPIKSQDYIHSFFDNHNGKIFIGISENTSKKDVYRARYYYLFPKDLRNSKTTSQAKRIFRKSFILLQKAFGAPRNKGLNIKKGSQWCSLPNDFVEYILSQKDFVFKHFNRTFCPDELVIQTLCWNSPFKERIYKIATDGNMRYIHWENGELLPIRESDFSAIMQSDKLLARKFNKKTAETFITFLKQ